MIVGLVANPVSSKDIRRLTGLARVIDIEEKANLVARLLVGIGSVAGVAVRAVDDPSGLVRRGVSLAGSDGPSVEYLPIEVEGSESDTRNAAAYFARMGASAIVTVGGDGTVRAAAEGWSEAPLVPVAAGTNNAFALTEEPTVIGLATALAVIGAGDAFGPTTAIEVETTEGRALAVIDAVVVRDHWVGTGAIWDPTQLVEGLVTTSRRTAVGIASISAALGPLATGHARLIRFGGDRRVRAVFGPGVVLEVPVANYVDLPIGTHVVLDQDAGLIALDGERRLPAKGGEARVVAGPRVLDLERAFRSL
ncbi:MAG: NAD(+)/NADH kinase [Acidimicrobiia bacterium]|nr:NAD(+)/NADH kinase [Acidimicrobiia bacterium]